VLVGCQVLIREEEHQVLVERGAKRLEERVIDLGEVDAVDLGAEGAAHRP
jgi:hypothetical protein